MSAALSPEIHPDIERLALMGWRCVPATRSKKGMFEGYLQAATHNLDQLARWSAEYPGCNWKVVPEGSGVWGLDVDVIEGGHADGVTALRGLCDKHGPLPPRPHGRSGSGGHLMVFKDDGRPMARGAGKPAPGLDTCAGRVAFTVSPSRNSKGLPYRWAVAPWDLNPPMAPAWLLDLLRPPQRKEWDGRAPILTESRARRALERAINSVMNAGPGQRNSTLNAASFTAGGLIAGGSLDQQEAVNALYSAGRYIGLDDAECRATIKSGLDGGTKQPLRGRRDA